jgi:hypothetical protein
MALTKQALRQGVHVMVNEQLATKEELIEMSQDWSEKREVFFVKCFNKEENLSLTEFTLKLN